MILLLLMLSGEAPNSQVKVEDLVASRRESLAAEAKCSRRLVALPDQLVDQLRALPLREVCVPADVEPFPGEVVDPDATTVAQVEEQLELLVAGGRVGVGGVAAERPGLGGSLVVDGGRLPLLSGDAVDLALDGGPDQLEGLVDLGLNAPRA